MKEKNIERMDYSVEVMMKTCKLENLKISAHAKERYAERIMDKENKADVLVFIQKNEQKIKEDIFKMITYGELLYSGKPTVDFNKQPVDIFLRDNWVVIVDIAKSNVVTLYSIDLGLGDEFNKEYISRLLEKLKTAKERYEDILIGINTQTETYNSIIKENLGHISEYRQIIKSLEKQNQGYLDVIESLRVDNTIAEREVRDIVATMIGKKVF